MRIEIYGDRETVEDGWSTERASAETTGAVEHFGIGRPHRVHGFGVSENARNLGLACWRAHFGRIRTWNVYGQKLK